MLRPIKLIIIVHIVPCSRSLLLSLRCSKHLQREIYICISGNQQIKAASTAIFKFCLFSYKSHERLLATSGMVHQREVMREYESKISFFVKIWGNAILCCLHIYLYTYIYCIFIPKRSLAVTHPWIFNECNVVWLTGR